MTSPLPVSKLQWCVQLQLSYLKEVEAEIPSLSGCCTEASTGKKYCQKHSNKETRKYKQSHGFKVGKHNSSTDFVVERGIRVMVHGDDFNFWIQCSCAVEGSWKLGLS